MSGGYIGHHQHRLTDIAFEIEELIALNDSKTLDRFGERIGNGFPQEITDKFEETVYTLRKVAEMVKRTDYLLSGDDSKESFLREWQEKVEQRTNQKP